ncbi:MAG: hypothetical protein M0R17_06385 [Candidatus Omnitrophica bacterium]|jgi:hypothetical protein|nr:hypothetical protein [Candidatus Omnitrophota bacterium]
MKTKKKFESTGLVYGNYWGGGKGSYPARKLYAKTKSDIIEQAEKGLDGSLDSGMGYESLIGALLIITEITTINVKGKNYVHKEDDIIFIGDLSENEQNFLIEQYSI